MDVTAEVSNGTETVIAVLRAIEPRLGGVHIESHTSIVDELRLDSLRFADLAVGLEKAFGLSEMPLQPWLDTEMDCAHPRFTVRSLACVCCALSAQGATRTQL